MTTSVEGWHVWVAAGIAIAALVLGTLVLYGFSAKVARKLVIGADNRASTSKFQAAAWTYALCFALLTIFVGHLFFSDFDDGWNEFLDEGLNSDYLWLLGIPSAGLVGAKTITQAKVTDDPSAKPPNRKDKPSFVDRVRELGSNDDDANPQPALADLQYLVFNTIALLYFLGAFLADVQLGLPPLPDSLIALTGVSATSYLAAKGAARNAPPKIVSVLPSTIKLGSAPVELTVFGTGFNSPLAPGAPAVTLDGVKLAVKDGWSETQLTTEVPKLAAATAAGLATSGPLNLVVLSPVGTPSEPYRIIAK